MWLPVGGSRRGRPRLTVMPKEHTTRSFAPPGPSAPFSPSIVPSVPGGGHPAAAVETPPVTSTEQPRSPNMSVRLSTERRHPGVPSSPAAGPFAPLATGQPGSDAAPFGAAGVLPDPADLRRAKDLTMARNGPPTTANPEDPANRRLVVVAAFDVVNFSALVEADEDARAGGVAGAAPRHRSADRRGRRPHLQVAGRRPADRVHQPGRGDADRARRPGRGRRRMAGPTATTCGCEMRCAIHMGEVTVEGTDLLGDGINIVSRLQEHAPAGGVLVSAAVMDLISGRLYQPIEDLGALRLRNISRPVQAYAVGAGQAAGDGAGARQLPAAAALDRRAAVRRFVGATADRRDGRTTSSWFSDGLVEDIIAALSCLPELVVISRASVLRYRGSVPDPRHDPPRARRALHADGQRAARRPPGAAVGRAVRLRKRHGDLERPLLRRGRRSLRAAGRAVGAGWWRRSRPRCRNRS